MEQDYYSVRLTYDPTRKKVWKAISEDLQKYIHGVVLDLGAGYCDFINLIKAEKKYAVDENPEFNHYAAKDVIPLTASCTNLKKFKTNTFDCIFCSNLFEHLDDNAFEQTLSEIKRVLKPGGKIIALQPNFTYTYQHYFDDYTHKKIFTHKSLSSHLKAKGFKIIKLRAKYLPFSLESNLPKSYWLTKLYLALPFKPLAGQMLVIGKIYK
ncbi:MAG: class I SAM-dependent methyltransferase [Candidatus Nanoarchaeia archaeon]